MKRARFAMVLSMLFLTSMLLAQTVNPIAVAVDAVPGYTSSPQNVAFKNTGASEITFTISISGPFSISKNECANGVKPGTHCNVFVIYTPPGIGTDTGTLGFTFDGQTVSVALTGNGVSIIPTSFTHVVYSSKSSTVNVTLYAAGNLIPDGEQVQLSCTDYEGVNQIFSVATLKNNKASIVFPARNDDWQCGVGYNGDREFAASGYEDFWINLCRPVKSCHDNGDAAVRPD